MTSLDLQRIVEAAKELGEQEVVTTFGDTTVEIKFKEPAHSSHSSHSTYSDDSLERFIDHQNPQLN